MDIVHFTFQSVSIPVLLGVVVSSCRDSLAFVKVFLSECLFKLISFWF